MTTTDYSNLSREELIARVQALERAEAKRHAEVSLGDAKFKAVFEQGLMFIGITDLEGRLLEVNKLALEVCGFRQEDVLSVPIWKSGWFNQIPGLPEKIQFAIREGASGKIFREDISYSWADGSEHFADFILSPVKDESGRVIFLSPTGVDITERKQAEAKLTQHERLLRLVTDGAPALISYIDAEFRYQSVNKQWLEWFGRPISEVEGKTVLEVLGADGWANVRPLMERAMAGESATFERRLVHPDGSIRWLEIKYVPDRDAAGRVVGFVAHAYDITLRKLAEENLSLLNVTLEQQVTQRTQTLEESARRLRALFNQAAVGLAEAGFGMDGQFFQVNRRFAEMLGYTEEELLTKTIRDVSHPEDQPPNHELLRQLKAREIREFTLEKRYLRKDGSLVWGRVIAAPLWKPGETPDREVAIIQDITEEKKSEAAKAEAELHYRTLFEQAGVGVAELDSRTGRFLNVNRKNLEILGLTREEMLAMTFMDITQPDDLAEDVTNMERMLKGESRGFTMEKRLLRKDKSVVWVSLIVTPLWQPGETPTSHIAVAKDITVSRQIEAALRVSEVRFRQLFESAPEAIFLLTTGADGGRILEASPTAEAMHGYSPGEMREIWIQDVDVPSDAALSQERLRRLDAGETLTFELEHFRKDGTTFPLEVKASEITIGDERFILASSATSRAANSPRLKSWRVSRDWTWLFRGRMRAFGIGT